MGNERFYTRHADAANQRVDLLCVGGCSDGRRFSVPLGQCQFSIAEGAGQAVDYRVATVAVNNAKYSFLTPASWTDAQALNHLFGGTA